MNLIPPASQFRRGNRPQRTTVAMRSDVVSANGTLKEPFIAQIGTVRVYLRAVHRYCQRQATASDTVYRHSFAHVFVYFFGMLYRPCFPFVKLILLKICQCLLYASIAAIEHTIRKSNPPSSNRYVSRIIVRASSGDSHFISAYAACNFCNISG